jgi:hypothetical protein
MNSSPLAEILSRPAMRAGPSVGGGGRRVTPPESSAWIVGRASAITGAESSDAGARLNLGGPESSESRGVASGWGDGVAADGPEAERRRGAIVAELLGSTEALVGLSLSLVGEDALFEVLSELDDALRNFGRSLSPLLFEELLDEFVVLSSELDVALRIFGRSESSPGALLDEVPVSSPELELARRSCGRSPEVGVSDEFPDELLAELLDVGLVMGRVGSSVACDAAACSSSVPSLTIAMVWAL